MALIEPSKLDTLLAELDVEWALVAGSKLERVYKFADFKQALNYVNKLGDLAEEKNHHPDIVLEYGKVTVVITTHSEGGLTDKDFEFAKAIEAIKT